MLGAAHACANPLTARCGIIHGLAVGLLLPHVVAYNLATASSEYAGLADGALAEGDLPGLLTQLFAAGGVPLRLRDHGVDLEALPDLAAAAATQWTAQFNPRPVQENDLHAIYESAY